MTPTFKDLFLAFFNAERHFLSKEDIRQDVIFDDDANEGTVRTLICSARKWLAEKQPSYEIQTITRHGYRLVKTGKKAARRSENIFVQFEKQQRQVLCADSKKKTERREVRPGGCEDWL